MKKRIVLAALLVCVTVICVVCAACNSKTVQLSAPVIQLDGYTISWSPVENADKYEVYEGKDKISTQAECTYIITRTEFGSYKYTVKAVSDNKNYKDSPFSNEVNYLLYENISYVLNTPVITVYGGVASWTADPNAAGYNYKIDGSEAQYTTQTSVEIEEGQSVAVQAVSCGTPYTDSEYSTPVTYIRILSSVGKTADPDKVTYFLDETGSLDLTGLCVQATYENDDPSEIEVTQENCTNLDSIVWGTTGKFVLEFDFIFEGETYTIEVEITVRARTIYDLNSYSTVSCELGVDNSFIIQGFAATEVIKISGEKLEFTSNGSETVLQAEGFEEGETLVKLTDGENVEFVNLIVARYIRTVEDFANIADNMSGYYLLVNNLEFTSANSVSIGQPPIGGQDKVVDLSSDTAIAFNGTFNGGGYVISGFYLKNKAANYDVTSYGMGIFGYIGESGRVCNLVIRNAYVKAGAYSAIVAGCNFGLIENIVIEENCTLITNYGKASVVCSYNCGTVRNVVSLLTQSAYDYSPYIEYLTAVREATGYQSVCDNCYIGDTSDLTSVLGMGWMYFDGYGTVYCNSEYKKVLSAESEWYVGVDVTLYVLQAEEEDVIFAVYDDNGTNYGLTKVNGNVYRLDGNPAAGTHLTIEVYLGGGEYFCTFTASVGAPYIVGYEADDFSHLEGIEIDINTLPPVQVNYSDGSVKNISVLKVEDWNLNGEAGVAQTVKLFYGTESEDYITVTVTVLAKALTSISVDLNREYKQTYSLGESIDITNLYLVLNYDNGTKESLKVTSAMLSSYDFSTTGEKTVTITYSSLTCDLKVVVIDESVTLTEITVEGADNLKFVCNSEISAALAEAGVKIVAHYSDGSSANVTITESMLKYSNTVNSSAVITVSYGGKTTTFTAEFFDKAVALNVPNTGVIKINDSVSGIDLTNCGFTLTMSSGAIETPDLSKISLSNKKYGTSEITFTYTDDYASVSVKATAEVWYVITEASEWSLMNDYTDGYFTLGNDITLDKTTSAVIGQAPYDKATEGYSLATSGVGTEKVGIAFTGKFDGAGHNINGFYTKYTSAAYNIEAYSLVPFPYIGETGYVGNFTLSGASITCGQGGTFISVLNFGIIENITVSSDCYLYVHYGSNVPVAALTNFGTVSGITCYVNQFSKNGATGAITAIVRTNESGGVEKDCEIIVPEETALIDDRSI